MILPCVDKGFKCCEIEIPLPLLRGNMTLEEAVSSLRNVLDSIKSAQRPVSIHVAAIETYAEAKAIRRWLSYEVLKLQDLGHLKWWVEDELDENYSATIAFIPDGWRTTLDKIEGHFEKAVALISNIIQKINQGDLVSFTYPTNGNSQLLNSTEILAIKSWLLGGRFESPDHGWCECYINADECVISIAYIPKMDEKDEKIEESGV